MKKEQGASTSIVPCPVVLLSVRGMERPNIITLSWAANVCSEPPTAVIGIRPNRHSHKMVKDAGDFVLNIPSENHIDAVVFAGTKSGREFDKFEECGLTPIPATKVSSPMIKECLLNIECRTRQVLSLGAHDLFIAEMVVVHIDESILDERGRLDPKKARLITYLPSAGEYWTLGKKLL